MSANQIEALRITSNQKWSINLETRMSPRSGFELIKDEYEAAQQEVLDDMFKGSILDYIPALTIFLSLYHIKNF